VAKFAHEVHRLNKQASYNVDYKVLFLGRHGEGWHNAAETFYGTPAWNCYWSLLQGNGTAYWEDAQLTVAGIKQTKIAHDFWASRINLQKISIPGSFYTSPLSRCLATANLTFGDLDLGKSKFRPVIKEYLREGVSLHTCDRRSKYTWIQSQYPQYRIQKEHSEYDELWNGVTAKTGPAQDLRSKTALDDIFSSDENWYISITSHSGEIASILRVLGHRAFSLGTGQVIPVFVKAETIRATSTLPIVTWSVSKHCTAPPLTSVSTGDCVCQSTAALVTTPLVKETPSVKPIVTFVPTSKH
jgi:broad specificity phosphatase PhoE